MANHETVLLKEAIDLLCVNPDGFYLDCTGGSGGHATELLSRLSGQAKLFICDFHSETVEGLKKRFRDDPRVQVHHSRFSLIFDNLDFSSRHRGFDGILADFGISSPQLEDARLGIGLLQNDIFLDMRIDDRLTLTAADVLKTYSQEKLADTFYYYGGERASRKIAAAIVADRKQGITYTTTDQLRDLCARVLGRYYRKRKIHPATKVFQALRIEVNQELEEIKVLLDQAPRHLKAEGRLVLISFHSGEDKLVKEKFRALAQTKDFNMPVKKVIKPDRDEVINNPRARSARMRVLERKENL